MKGTAASALFTGSASPAGPTGSSFGLLFVAIATLVPFFFSLI
jgi:hypothetical protein